MATAFTADPQQVSHALPSEAKPPVTYGKRRPHVPSEFTL